MRSTFAAQERRKKMAYKKRILINDNQGPKIIGQGLKEGYLKEKNVYNIH